MDIFRTHKKIISPKLGARLVTSMFRSSFLAAHIICIICITKNKISTNTVLMYWRWRLTKKIHHLSSSSHTHIVDSRYKKQYC